MIATHLVDLNLFHLYKIIHDLT